MTSPERIVLTEADVTTAHPALRLAIVVLTVAAAAAVVVAHRGDPIVAAAAGVVVMAYGALAIVDAAQQRLPNRITLPLAGAVAALVVVGGVVRAEPGRAVGAIALSLVFAVVLVVFRFGMGDVKLALTVGLVAGWFGTDAVVATMLVASVAGALVAVALIAVHRRRDLTFAYGPFLALGSVAGMLVGAG